MFPASYFGPRPFAPRFFPKHGAAVALAGNIYTTAILTRGYFDYTWNPVLIVTDGYGDFGLGAEGCPVVVAVTQDGSLVAVRQDGSLVEVTQDGTLVEVTCD